MPVRAGEGGVVRETITLEIELEATAVCCATPVTLATTAMATELAQAFKALGNPVRVQIIELLSRCDGQVCVCDIESYFELSQPTISHHLKVLREAGLVTSDQRGLWVHYRTVPEKLAALRDLLGVVCC